MHKFFMKLKTYKRISLKGYLLEVDKNLEKYLQHSSGLSKNESWRISTFHILKFSFTHFLAISLNFCDWEVCRVWLKFLLASVFSSPNFQPLNGSNFWTSCPIWINNPSLESYYVFVFKFYAFDHHVQGINISKIRGKIFFSKNLNNH